jgi:hypothetical protein
MSDPVPSWQAIRDAEDAAVRAEGHAALCAKARKLMPNLSAEVAAEMRLAMFAGPDSGLRELVLEHWTP